MFPGSSAAMFLTRSAQMFPGSNVGMFPASSASKCQGSSAPLPSLPMENKPKHCFHYLLLFIYYILPLSPNGIKENI